MPLPTCASDCSRGENNPQPRKRVPYIGAAHEAGGRSRPCSCRGGGRRRGEGGFMRRVVVTGMGVVSSIGNNTQEVLASLREARSGIVRAEKYAELGFRCQVHGAPTLDTENMIDRKAARFMGGGAAWNYVAMSQAIQDAGLAQSDV